MVMRVLGESMNTLVVYYSRTGTTRKVATTLANRFACDVEEVIDTVNRHGVLGRLRAGRDAKLKRLTTLHPVRYDPSMYDLVVIGTPVWNFTVSPPIRTYLTLYGDRMHDAAFVTTQGGVSVHYAAAEMRQLCANASWLHLNVIQKDVEANRHTSDVEQFIEAVRSHLDHPE